MINSHYGKFADVCGVSVGDEVTITLKEKAGALILQEINNLEYTNIREDYESDEEFANFRPVVMAGIGNGVLYRSCSPVNNEFGRAAYAYAFMEKSGIRTVMNLANLSFSVPSCFVLDSEASQENDLVYRIPDSAVFLEFYTQRWEGSPDTFYEESRAMVQKLAEFYGGELSWMQSLSSFNGVPEKEYYILNVPSSISNRPYTLTVRCCYNQAAQTITFLIYADRQDGEYDYLDIYIYVAESVAPDNSNLTVSYSDLTPAFREQMDVYRSIAVLFTEYLSRQDTGIGLQLDATYQSLSCLLDAAYDKMNAVDIYSLSSADRLYYDQTRELFTSALSYREGAFLGGAVSSLADLAGDVAERIASDVLSELLGEELGSAGGRIVGGMAGNMAEQLGDALNDPDGLDKVTEFFDMFLE